MYTRYPGRVAAEVAASGVSVTAALEDVARGTFDVAHVHHNLTAVDIRHALPRVPMLFLSHGVLPFLETPPAIDVGIGQYAAVSEGGAEHLRKLGVERPVEVHRNLVDVRQFRPGTPVSPTPRSVVVLSSQMTAEKLKIVEGACRIAGVETHVIGAPGPRVTQDEVLTAIHGADVVIGQGRGIIEAMLCERSAIVFNPPASDGLVTQSTFGISMAENFSGRALKRDLDAPGLATEIQEVHTVELADLRRVATDHFGLTTGVERLLATYERLAATSVPAYDAATVAWAHAAFGISGEYAAEFHRRCSESELAAARNETAEQGRKNNTLTAELARSRAETASLEQRLAAADRRWLPGRAHQLREWLRRMRTR